MIFLVTPWYIPPLHSLGLLRFSVEAVAAKGTRITSIEEATEGAQHSPSSKASRQRDVAAPLRQAATSHFSLVARQRPLQDGVAVSFLGH